MANISLSLDSKTSYHVDPGERRLDIASAPNDGELNFCRGKLDWKQLDQLKNLTELTYSGPDLGAVAYLKSRKRKTVKTFDWLSSGRKRFDFSDLRLNDLGLTVDGHSVSVKLPNHRNFADLRILDAGNGKLTFHSSNQGRGLYLTLCCTQASKFPVITGLDQLHTLHVFELETLDLTSIARISNLKQLAVAGPTALRGLEHLSSMASLQEFSANVRGRIAVASFPPVESLPKSLELLSLDGLTQDQAAALKHRLRGFKRFKMISSSKEESGIRTQGNPFRHWIEEYGETPGQSACKAWNRAKARLKKASGRGNRSKIKSVISDFVTTFNRMDLEEQCDIDTIMRDDILIAFEQLVEPLKGGDDLLEIYDELREF